MCGGHWAEATKAMTKTESDLLEALKAIVEEVAGASQPYSADSFLPPHMVHDARKLIEEHEQAIARQQHEDKP